VVNPAAGGTLPTELLGSIIILSATWQSYLNPKPVVNPAAGGTLPTELLGIE
jgi:hypothetical protein